MIMQRALAEANERLAEEKARAAGETARGLQTTQEIFVLRETLEGRLRDEKERVEALQVSAAEAVRAAEQQRAAIEASLFDRDLELARLRGEVVETKGTREALERELEGARARTVEAEAVAKESEERLMKLGPELVEARGELGRLSSECAALTEELQRARAEAQKLRTVASTARGLIDGVVAIELDLVRLREDAEHALDAPPSKDGEPAAPPVKTADSTIDVGE